MGHKYLLLVLFTTGLLTFTSAQSSCRTPDNYDGQCVPQAQCSIFNLNFRRNSGFNNYLKQLKCGDSEFVCCRHRFLSYSTQSSSTTNSKDIELNAVNCGEVNQDKISHGNATVIGEFPFMALLGYREESGAIEFKCGGSLINSRYILTAAHCVTNNLVSVRLGEHTLNQEEDCLVSPTGRKRCAPPVKDYNIEEQIRHQDYKRDGRVHDIALLRLSESVLLNDRSYINTICLPLDTSSNLQRVDSHLLVAGWGKTETSFRSQSLMKARIPVQPVQLCRDTYKIDEITDSLVLCVGGEDRVDTCKGDSGGPLFWTGRVRSGSRYILHGITASGYPSCGGLYRNTSPPAIYTNVANYIDWIRQNMH